MLVQQQKQHKQTFQITIEIESDTEMELEENKNQLQQQTQDKQLNNNILISQNDSYEFNKSIIEQIVQTVTELDPPQMSRFNTSQQQQGIITRLSQKIYNLNNKSKKPLFLNDFLNNDILYKKQVIQKRTKNSYNFYQMNVMKQHLGNTCGYHAAYNLIESINMIKSQNLDYVKDQYRPNQQINPLQDKAKFWKFKFHVSNYLWQYAQKYEDNENWPWDYRNTIFGDFERSYWNLCKNNHPHFTEAFKSEDNISISVLTWQFQFGRSVQSWNDQLEHQKKFDDFRKFDKKNKHKVLVLMMGVTQHWSSLLAHKYNDVIEFYFFDSYNEVTLKWDENKINSYIQEKSDEKKKEGRKPYTEFNIWCIKNGITDTQVSSQLLIDCLLGNTTLTDYKFNSDFKVFAVPFQEQILENYGKFVQKSVQDQSIALNGWLESYYHDLKNYFQIKNCINYLDENHQMVFENMRVLILQAADYFKSQKQNSRNSKVIYISEMLKQQQQGYKL